MASLFSARMDAGASGVGKTMGQAHVGTPAEIKFQGTTISDKLLTMLNSACG